MAPRQKKDPGVVRIGTRASELALRQARLVQNALSARDINSELVTFKTQSRPKISTLVGDYKGPGRDHWGAVQSVFLAGGGVTGGRVLGSSDKNGGYPATDPQTPENFAATIYTALGIPKSASWQDTEARPHNIYHADPMPVMNG